MRRAIRKGPRRSERPRPGNHPPTTRPGGVLFKTTTELEHTGTYWNWNPCLKKQTSTRDNYAEKKSLVQQPDCPALAKRRAPFRLTTNSTRRTHLFLPMIQPSTARQQKTPAEFQPVFLGKWQFSRTVQERGQPQNSFPDKLHLSHESSDSFNIQFRKTDHIPIGIQSYLLRR